MGVPMKWEIARTFVVGTGGSGFCAEAARSGLIGFFMKVAPYSSLGVFAVRQEIAFWKSSNRAQLGAWHFISGFHNKTWYRGILQSRSPRVNPGPLAIGCENVPGQRILAVRDFIHCALPDEYARVISPISMLTNRGSFVCGDLTSCA